MTLDEVRNYYKTVAEAMRALGLSYGTFYYWSKLGYIPSFQQKRYEKATNGALKAEENSKDRHDTD